MTPVTHRSDGLRAVGVIVVALWQSGDQGGTVGGFVAFITAMLMLVAPIKHLSDVMGPSRAAWPRWSADWTSSTTARASAAARTTAAARAARSSCAT
jgi:ABC-type multidrug transport system fused ATPase/permease subunit